MFLAISQPLLPLIMYLFTHSFIMGCCCGESKSEKEEGGCNEILGLLFILLLCLVVMVIRGTPQPRHGRFRIYRCCFCWIRLCASFCSYSIILNIAKFGFHLLVSQKRSAWWRIQMKKVTLVLPPNRSNLKDTDRGSALLSVSM